MPVPRSFSAAPELAADHHTWHSLDRGRLESLVLGLLLLEYTCSEMLSMLKMLRSRVDLGQPGSDFILFLFELPTGLYRPMTAPLRMSVCHMATQFETV